MTRPVVFGGAAALALAGALAGCGGHPGAPATPATPPTPATVDAPEPTASNGAITAAASGFTTLTYNVAGLLEPFSSGSPATNTPLISCAVRPFDVVNVQEDFNYHAALYDTCDDHPFRSPTSGGMGFGSGLNTLSRLPYEDWDRVKWDACSGVDCLTPKGFTIARLRLAEGVYVDLYNLHTQAQTTDADLAARRRNVLQLAGFIEWQSAGNAVIVMGDTNTRYTRDGDNIRELLARGFTDVWVSRLRGGSVPAFGDAKGACSPDTTSAECEIVDKVLYRDNGLVGLAPVAYLVDKAGFLDPAGADLSDHWPVKVEWAYTLAADRRMSDRLGGPHGDAFNDLGLLPARPVVRTLTLRSGSRVDAVALTLSTGDVLSHGGTGGDAQTLALADGEVLTSVELCSAKHNNTTRVFYAGFATSRGATLSGGARTSSCATYRAPEGWQIVGFQGRSGDEIDKLGVVYAPALTADAPGERTWETLANRASGLCLDVQGEVPQPGTPVIQWTCSGADWQRWGYDPASGLVRSKRDPRYCLDNAGSFTAGVATGLVVWPCTGNAHQRFLVDRQGGIVSMRSDPSRVLDGFGTTPGSPAITWSDWGGANQRWDVGG